MKNIKRAFQILIVILANPLFGSDTLLPRIDTHIHLYDTRREGSSTFLNPTVHEKIYFPHFAETFVDTAGPAGINFAVVVEASQRREDNFWLIQHVDTSDALVAFIANLDPRDSFYIADLDSLCTYKKFRGIRIRPVTPINLGDATVIEKLAQLSHKNLVLELGGNGVDPKTISAIARRFPNMNIIMNHLAGISMQGDQVAPGDYIARLTEFAREPNVYCKISALYTLVGQSPAPITADAYKPLIDPVIEAFGPDRVIFGSNWTLSDMHGSYTHMIVMLDEYLAGREEPTPEQFYYSSINTAYGINQDKVDYTGTSNEDQTVENVLIYPNPADLQIHISSREHLISQIKIMDLKGRLVYDREVSVKDLEVDISKWPVGFYFVETWLQNEITVHKILVI